MDGGHALVQDMYEWWPCEHDDVWSAARVVDNSERQNVTRTRTVWGQFCRHGFLVGTCSGRGRVPWPTAGRTSQCQRQQATPTATTSEYLLRNWQLRVRASASLVAGAGDPDSNFTNLARKVKHRGHGVTGAGKETHYAAGV